MIIINNSSVADVKYGSRQVDKVYHGSNLVWERDDWDGDYVYLRVGNIDRGYGDILLGGSGGLLYDTGSSNPNYNGLTSITKYGFTISTSDITKSDTDTTQMHSNYSLLNLFDGKNSDNSYALVSRNDASSRLFTFYVYMPFNQWELTQVGYWEGIFKDSTDFVNEIYLVPPDRSEWVWQRRVEPFSNKFSSFPCSYSFNNGDSKKNRFVLGLVTATEKEWHFYTDIIFEIKIPYTEYKTWKQQYHVPVKIKEKTINNETIGTIVMKGNS